MRVSNCKLGLIAIPLVAKLTGMVWRLGKSTKGTTLLSSNCTISRKVIKRLLIIPLFVLYLAFSDFEGTKRRIQSFQWKFYVPPFCCLLKPGPRNKFITLSLPWNVWVSVNNVMLLLWLNCIWGSPDFSANSKAFASILWKIWSCKRFPLWISLCRATTTGSRSSNAL